MCKGDVKTMFAWRDFLFWELNMPSELVDFRCLCLSLSRSLSCDSWTTVGHNVAFSEIVTPVKVDREQSSMYDRCCVHYHLYRFFLELPFPSTRVQICTHLCGSRAAAMLCCIPFYSRFCFHPDDAGGGGGHIPLWTASQGPAHTASLLVDRAVLPPPFLCLPLSLPVLRNLWW